MARKKITEQAVRAFGAYLTENEKAAATVQKYLHDVRCFARYVGDGVLEKGTVLRYKEELAKSYALTSANSMLAAMNAFLRFAGWQELCVRQFKLQRQAYCSAEKELTRKEYAALIRAAEEQKDRRLSLVIQTVCGTGIRVSELRWITVEAVRRGEAEVSCKGKTRKIFLVKVLQKKLLAYAARQGILSGVLFTSKNGKPLDRSNIWRQMKQLCRQAGVRPEKVFPHNLRHLFARTFYGIEKDIAKLADILGHSNINTTRIYIVTTGAEHQRRMEKLHLIL